jgi:hypothetical protein
MSFTPIDSPDFSSIRETLEKHPRLSGYYLTRFVALNVPRGEAWSDVTLDALFESFDDQPWPPVEARPADQRWADYECSLEVARQELLDALVGGFEIGHTSQTVGWDVAHDVWRRFEGLFGPDRRYYRGLGLGDRSCAFQRGIAIVDGDRAGMVCVVEND